jgi:hypothetical protein
VAIITPMLSLFRNFILKMKVIITSAASTVTNLFIRITTCPSCSSLKDTLEESRRLHTQYILDLKEQIRQEKETTSYYRNLLHKKFGLTVDNAIPEQDPVKIRGHVSRIRDLQNLQTMMDKKVSDERQAYWEKKNQETELKEMSFRDKAEEVNNDDLEVLDGD